MLSPFLSWSIIGERTKILCFCTGKSFSFPTQRTMEKAISAEKKELREEKTLLKLQAQDKGWKLLFLSSSCFFFLPPGDFTPSLTSPIAYRTKFGDGARGISIDMMLPREPKMRGHVNDGGPDVRLYNVCDLWQRDDDDSLRCDLPTGQANVVVTTYGGSLHRKPYL